MTSSQRHVGICNTLDPAMLNDEIECMNSIITVDALLSINWRRLMTLILFIYVCMRHLQQQEIYF